MSTPAMVAIRRAALARVRAEVYLRMDPDSSDALAARERAWRVMLHCAKRTARDLDFGDD